ncbi:MAG: phosphopantetheine-binding protein [Myxococcota bacterium]|nr:phosphopantetheine-binding protein [Myxococcota bacterium]
MNQDVPDLVARILGFPREQVQLSSALREDLGLDPYDLAELADELELELGATIPDTALRASRTVGDLGRSLRLAG